MKEQFKIIYEKVLKPAARIITAPFIMPTAIRKHIERVAPFGEDIESSYKYHFGTDGIMVEATFFGTLFNGVSLWESIKSFSEGRTIEGLALLASTAANVASGAYEIYRGMNNRFQNHSFS
jgi:hypothetical protein